MARMLGLVVVTLLYLAPPSQAVELRGTVLTADGSPAVGATVSAAAVFYKPALRHRTKTDARGQFRFDLQPLTGAQRWSVCARLGRQGGEANEALGTVKVDAGKDPAPVVIRMVERGEIRGRVLQAEDDRPIGEVKLFLDSGELLITDAAGRFVAGGLPLKDHSLIPVTPGRVRQYVLFDNSLRPDAELDIRLERGGKIAGSIVDEMGKSIPGAYLSRASSGTALTLNGWDQVCEPDGSFVYDGLYLEKLFYNVEAAAPDYQPKQLWQPLSRPGQPDSAAVFQLNRAVQAGTGKQEPPTSVKAPAVAKLPRRELKGVVVGPKNKPVAGAVVRWGATMYEDTQRQASTDNSGIFQLRDVPDRDGYITIMTEEFAPQFIEVKQGKTELSVSLELGEFARGTVRNSAGRPIEGVEVVPVMASPDPSLCNPLWLTERRTRTDAEGRFLISGLPTVGVRFDFLHEGYSDQRNVVLQLGGQENEIKLVAGGAIRGRVLDPEGKPVRDFRIRLEIPRNLKLGERAGGYYAGFDWYGVSFTSADGTFVLSGVPAEAWLRVHALAPGYGQAVVDRVQAKPLDALPPTAGLTLQLTAPHSLQVQVVTEFLQKPVQDAVITLIDEHLALDERFNWGYDNLWGQRGWTDNDGTAAFPKLAFAEATVAVECPGSACQRFGWRRGEKELRVTLVPETVISGIVRKDGQPLGNYYVRLTSGVGDTYSAAVEPKDLGKFVINQLPAGEYTVEITDERTTLNKQTLTLAAGEQRAIEVD
jgi:hypothetical protein